MKNDAMTALVDYVFRTTELKRVYLKTLEENTRAQKCFEKSGFVWYGRLLNEGTNFMAMEITRKQWRGESPI
jgi:RimJ/RimL family protein N-acetyltransferase